MNKIVKINCENGYFSFKLYQILKDRNVSINKLMKDTNTDFKVIQRLAKGNIIRVDITVIARLCDYLNCDMSDIITYIRNNR